MEFARLTVDRQYQPGTEVARRSWNVTDFVEMFRDGPDQGALLKVLDALRNADGAEPLR